MNGVVRVPMDVFRLRHVVAAAASAAALWIALARPFDLGVSHPDPTSFTKLAAFANALAREQRAR